MRLNLTGGAYQAASLAASAQRCVNLFLEYIPAAQGEPIRATHLPTPGVVRLASLPGGAIRGVYAASNGDLYVVAGSRLYYVGADLTATFIAALTTSTGPVSMADNTLSMVVVDGSARGMDPYSWAGGIQVDLSTRAPQPMPTEDDGFYGADRADYLATFFLFNKPGTPLFYTSEGMSVAFIPDAFAGKVGAQDRLAAVVAVGGHILLIGTHTSEPWALTVAPDLPVPFQPMSGAILEHGCSCASSIAKADGTVFMLSQDRQGRGVALKVVGGQSARISTHAIENAIAGYADQTARGFCYQYRGHTFYVLSFSVATWVYDLATEQWHEWVSLSDDGSEGPYRAGCFAFAYGRSIVGDRETGALYEMLPGADDAGRPIRRIRSFPHLSDNGKRISYTRFVADMAAGAPGNVTLRFSDDRGATYGNPLTQRLDGHGSLTSLQFRRLGMARDRVFELKWDAPGVIALHGAFIEIAESST